MTKMEQFLVQAPDDRLRTRSREVDSKLASTKETIDAVMTMSKTLDSEIIALAANQIGIMERVITYKERDGCWKAMVNPVVVNRSYEHKTEFEGCGSLQNPRFQIRVPRPVEVDIEWDTGGQTYVDTFEGTIARRILHEIDHLDGILITDYTGTSLGGPMFPLEGGNLKEGG